MVEAWNVNGRLSAGLRPETVYLAGPDGDRHFAGALPHLMILRGNLRGLFSADRYVPPDDYDDVFDGLHVSYDNIGVTVALIIWYATQQEFAFELSHQDYPEWEVWDTKRRTFTGPAELGRLLNAALVWDRAKRMKVHELRVELEALAHTWGVDIPPFPPAGLE